MSLGQRRRTGPHPQHVAVVTGVWVAVVSAATAVTTAALLVACVRLCLRCRRRRGCERLRTDAEEEDATGATAATRTRVRAVQRGELPWDSWNGPPTAGVELADAALGGAWGARAMKHASELPVVWDAPGVPRDGAAVEIDGPGGDGWEHTAEIDLGLKSTGSTLLLD